jgi:uncharacterized protein YbbC (DUF1343 family)
MGKCQGYDLGAVAKRRMNELNLNWIIEAKNLLGDSVEFLTQPSFFNRLAGTSTLKDQIMSGMSMKEIRSTWKPGLDAFKKIRSNYLLYN